MQSLYAMFLRPQKTVALVTPDRYLARRVISELKRWDILVEDLAGTQISNMTMPFIQLMVEWL